MDLKIVKMDHMGRGIGYIEKKICFVENALPGEVVKVEITRDKKDYCEAKVKEYIATSDIRIKCKCTYFSECGGCQYRNMSYNNSLSMKLDKVSEILYKYSHVSPKITVVKSDQKDSYRNKVEFKIQNGKIGFYKTGTHELVEIDRCLNVEESINSFLFNNSLLHIENGELTVKTNYNGELILIIDTLEKNNIEIEELCKKNKIVGIVFNDKLVYGVDHFIEIIDDMFFKVSYNSFFQVNRNINSKLFKLLDENIETDDTILDLCCGVGTLSIVASRKAKKVYGIEIVENAIKDAIINARMNKRENVEFMLGDAFDAMNKIADKIDTIIVDPPRKGLNKIAIDNILNMNPQKIIYISCNPNTLSRDLNYLLENYEIKKQYLLDMFSYSYHVESVVILEKTK